MRPRAHISLFLLFTLLISACGIVDVGSNGEGASQGPPPDALAITIA